MEMNHDAVHMKRKVQQLGSSTLAVSVPADWATRHNLEKGDEILLQRDENGGSLLLVPPDPSIEDTEVTIDLNRLSTDMLKRAIDGQYVLGRQLIHITSDERITNAQRNAVIAAERRLMGLGIIEEGEREITVRCSVAPTDFELPTLLGRLWRTERTMRSATLETLTATADSDPDKIEVYRVQAEKLFYLFLRLLFATYRNPRLNHTVGLTTGFPLIGFRSVAQDIRLMAGIATQLSTLTTESPPPPTAVIDRFETVHERLDSGTELIQSALVSPDDQTIMQAQDQLGLAADAIADTQSYIETEQPDPVLKLYKMAVLLERSIQHAQDSLEVATHLLFRETLALD